MQNNFIFIDLFLSQKCYKYVYPKYIVRAQTKHSYILTHVTVHFQPQSALLPIANG